MKRQLLTALLMLSILPVLAKAATSKKVTSDEIRKQVPAVQKGVQPSFFEPKTEDQISQLALSLDESVEAPAADIEFAD